MGIPILLLEDYLKFGIQKPYVWEPAKVPHALIIGGTGSGKTYFCKRIIGKICMYTYSPEIFIMDYKGDDDFSFLDGCKNFYRFDECSQGLESFYQRFLARQQHADISRTPLFLYFDEFASFLNSLDKKTAEEQKKKVANLLMLSRSFNCFLIFSLQRADASYFATARDNFNLVISLGNLSTQGIEMFYNSCKNEILPDRKRGTGYLLESGSNLHRVVVPSIQNMNKLHLVILKNMVSHNEAIQTET